MDFLSNVIIIDFNWWYESFGFDNCHETIEHQAISKLVITLFSAANMSLGLKELTHISCLTTDESKRNDYATRIGNVGTTTTQSWPNSSILLSIWVQTWLSFSMLYYDIVIYFMCMREYRIHNLRSVRHKSYTQLKCVTQLPLIMLNVSMLSPAWKTLWLVVKSSTPSPWHQPWHQPDDDHAPGNLWMKIFQLPWILYRIS